MNQFIKAGWQLTQSYMNLSPVFYKKTMPTPVAHPSILLLNEALCKKIQLNPMYLTPDQLSGNTLIENSNPIAQAYVGHQFGYLNMLGDGRAILLGEQTGYDVQLKGAGQTTYSRQGDGRATLGSMIREYIISEAMFYLNIPTTRSLAVIKTGEQVIREKAYPGGILTRVSKSHIRVGTFQYAAIKGESYVKELADYTIEKHYPEVRNSDNPYLDLFNAIMINQARLIALWQSVGFIHGVMNTDNMSIVGETIDYGPCAFMDEYDEKTVFSSIDTQGRYAYNQQPNIALWNLARLVECLLPLIHTNMDMAIEIAEETLKGFYEIYESYWISNFRNKLGISDPEASDVQLVKDLLDLMEKYQLDYTNTFYTLSLGEIPEALKDWSIRWMKHTINYEMMKKSNPWVIPRNHQVQKALTHAENGDFNVLKDLLKVIASPFDYTEATHDYRLPPRPDERVTKTYCGT